MASVNSFLLDFDNGIVQQAAVPIYYTISEIKDTLCFSTNAEQLHVYIAYNMA